MVQIEKNKSVKVGRREHNSNSDTLGLNDSNLEIDKLIVKKKSTGYFNTEREKKPNYSYITNRNSFNSCMLNLSNSCHNMNKGNSYIILILNR